MTVHFHKWKTQYKTINYVDCPSGMVCDCGKTLSQDETEDYINEYQRVIKDIEEIFLQGNSDNKEKPIGFLDAQ